MTTIVAALLLASSTATSGVPTAEHFASCNAEARDAVKSRAPDSAAASPIMKDRERADAVRRGAPPRTDDGQLQGIDPARASDPAYQAAYRTCMRRSGF
jgi:hypothetical protein